MHTLGKYCLCSGHKSDIIIFIMSKQFLFIDVHEDALIVGFAFLSYNMKMFVKIGK